MLGRSLAAGLVALFALILSASCGNEANPAGGNGDMSQGVPAPPEGAPLDTSRPIPKRTLVQRDLLRTGDQTVSEESAPSDGNDGRILSPTAESPLAWAIYRYEDVAPYYKVEGVELNLAGYDQPNANQVFVGFADYNAGTWKWQPLPDPNTLQYAPVQVSIPGGDLLATSPDGSAYIAVVSYGRELHIKSCTLQVDEAFPAPLGLTASVRTVDGTIQLNWIDPALTFDPDGAGPGIFEYYAVVVERSSGGLSGPWNSVGTVHLGKTHWEDLFPLVPYVGQMYRVRLAGTGGQLGQPSAIVVGEMGVRPVAEFEASVNGTEIMLDPAASFDGDSTNVINQYQWTVSYMEQPGFKYEFARDSGAAFAYEMTDLTKLHRIDLTVLDDELFTSDASQGYDATSEPYFLWSPNLGCVQDDPALPDPKDTVTGQSATLSFEIQCGQGPFMVEFDTWFDGSIRSNNGVPVTLLGTFPSTGTWSIQANIPAAQPAGEYYFALRVTDQSDPSQQWIYMWPDKVTLEPQN